MISELDQAGPIWWRIIWAGIRGGIIEVKIHRNRISWVKKFMFNDDESFETAIKILKNKVTRVLHYKTKNISTWVCLLSLR